MPFSNPKQELYLMINHPKIYKKWKKKYGDAPGFKKYIRNINRRKKGKKRKYAKKRKKKKR